MARTLSVLIAVVLGGCGAVMSGAVDSNAVQLAAAVSNPVVMANAEGQVVARIRVTTQSAPPATRPPINLVLVIDTSASMRGEAIARAREAAAIAVKSLSNGDRLSIVAFHSTADVLIKSTEIDRSSRRKALDAIAKMAATGTTDMVGGLVHGLDQLRKGRKDVGDEGINRIMLLSDGVPNDPSQVVSYASSARSYGATITTLGLGLDYDEVLLGQVAQASGGTLHYIEEPAQVAAVFESEVLQIHRVVAQNVQLGLVFGPGVMPLAVHGYPGSVNGRSASISLGQMGAGEVRDVFVPLQVPARSDSSVIELLDAVLSYNDVGVGKGAKERTTKRAFLALEVTADDNKIGPGRNLEIELGAARAEAAAATVQAIALARGNQLDQARTMLKEAERLARKRAREHGGDEKLDGLADDMVKTRKALPTYVTVVQKGASVQPGIAGDDSAESKSMRSIKRSYDAATVEIQGR